MLPVIRSLNQHYPHPPIDSESQQKPNVVILHSAISIMGLGCSRCYVEDLIRFYGALKITILVCLLTKIWSRI
eukprot:scaffold88095_cov64-Attheya_sp.AAC.3